jgi:hypothetical protein
MVFKNDVKHRDSSKRGNPVNEGRAEVQLKSTKTYVSIKKLDLINYGRNAMPQDKVQSKAPYKT